VLINATGMTVSLPALADGVYTVAWKVTSLTDGHLTNGSYPFAVGKVAPGALAANAQTSSASTPLSQLVAKWLLLLSLAVLMAEMPFRQLVWAPAAQADLTKLPAEAARPPAWKSLYQLGLIGLFLGTALSLLAQSGQMLGSALAAPWDLVTYQVLFQSRLGLIWLARLGLALACFWLSNGNQPSWKRLAALPASLALLLTISLTSHAATGEQSWLPVLSDWLHLIGMSVWFGGLAYFLSGLLALRRLEEVLRTRLVSLSIQKFSAMALVSVALIGVTGLYAAYLRIGTLQALTTSLYGYSMLVKQGFVGLLMLLAAGNLLVISPQLKRSRLDGGSNIQLVKRFTLMVSAEALLAVLLLSAVSYLTYLPPAKASPPASGLNASAQVDDLGLVLSITPGTIGQNSFKLEVTSNGQPLQGAKEVLLRFTPLNKNIPAADTILTAAGSGQFTASAANLSLPADWQIQAIVRRENRFDAMASFQFSLAGGDGASAPDATPRVAGGLLALDGLLFGAAFLSLNGQRMIKFGLGLPLGLILLAGGIFLLASPPAASAPGNPIPSSSQSIHAGSQLFSTHCAACHGEMGMGDGPLAKTLNPRPADLMVQAAPGVHTDVELFGWISNGFPGSAMPGFKTSLTDSERWNLVNFIRTLGGG
jgi:copper transport protein